MTPTQLKRRQDLLEKRNGLIARQREILDGADTEDRGLSAEERQEYDRIATDVTELDDRLNRRAQLDDAARQSWEEPGERTGLDDVDPDDELPAIVRDGDHAPRLRVARHAVVTRALAGDPERARNLSWNQYRQMLAGQPPQDGLDYRAAFYKLMTFGPHHLDAREHRALTVGTATAGGNLVPTDFERQLLELLRDQVSIRSVARVFTTATGNPIKVPRVTDHGDAVWLDEEEEYPESDEAFDQVTFSAHKAGTLIKVSEELLMDAFFDLEEYIRAEFALRIGYLQNAAYAGGDGTGKPKGVLLDAQSAFTAADDTTVTADELIRLVYSVRRPFRVRGTFLINDVTIGALRVIKDSTGQYIWSPGLTGTEPDRILGYPVIADADMPTLAASAKGVAFGDFGYYWIRDVNGLMFQRLNELFAKTGQVGFRAFHRTDGHLVNTEAVKVITQAA